MTAPGGEMPFLDHLEELRARILRALGALVVGFGAGLWLVERFQLVTLLKRPIEPFLPDGRLTVLSPTEPLLIVFKLGFLVGLLLASPAIIWQVWAFLSPALYDRERRVIVPSLVIGVVLFLIGAGIGYELVVPQALRVLFGFQSEALAPMITYDAYFAFVLQIMLALGLSFELPLVIMILAALGVVTPQGLGRFRRAAIVLSCVAGALLSPGADLVSMVMMTIPLIFLYEVGVAGAAILHRRRLRRAAAAAALLLAALGLAPGPLAAQQDTLPKRPPADTTAPDSLRAPPRFGPGEALDSAQAARLGLPTAPAMQFAPPDSAYSALLQRPGYRVVKFRGDSAELLAGEKRIRLTGRAMTERDGSVMEARTIDYADRECLLDASGDPKLFGEGEVLVGDRIRYDTCRRRGVIKEALTNFEDGGTTWFLRGDVAKDSVATRIFAGSGELTSCDLPVPHYHFAARKLKWVSNTMVAARSVVIYVRDVPLFWLPFLWQDTRQGRRSGILVPQVGLNDIVRTSSSYNRQITNVGYYWAISDYMDATFRLDWFSRRFLTFGGAMQYRILDRFLSGNLGVERTSELGDVSGTNTEIRWSHQQQFNAATSLNVQFNYVTNTRVVDDNAIDPTLNTRTINSQARFTRRFRWGDLAVGGNARQTLSDGSVTAQLPSLSLTPKPIALGANATWSPSLNVTNDLQLNQRRGFVFFPRPGGGVDSTENNLDSRILSVGFATPVRVGGFNWANDIRYRDESRQLRDSVRVPDLGTSDPTDSVTVYYAGTFQSELDWNTGINLPILFRGSWKLQPTLGVTNTAGGAFAIRNRNTDGEWVAQGKRFLFSLSATPTFFGFYNAGIIPGLSRIRHSVNPLIQYNYAPRATVPRAYAEALARPGQELRLESPAQQTLSVSLNQSFEGKTRALPEDTLGTSARKLRLLSIQTSAFGYDFEQAKEEGRTGWNTQRLTNSLLSDLLPGFNVSLTHNLWDGPVGFDDTEFDPFLEQLNANFSIGARTLRSIFGLIGLAGRDTTGVAPPDQGGAGDPYGGSYGFGNRYGRGGFNTRNPLQTARRPFSSTFNLTIARSRPLPGAEPIPARKNLGYTLNFSPTPFWGVRWQAQYNLTDSRFESQVVELDRDLHEWRARFSLQRNANGNVAFFFSIFLTDLPDLKWDYNQTTFEN